MESYAILNKILKISVAIFKMNGVFTKNRKPQKMFVSIEKKQNENLS